MGGGSSPTFVDGGEAALRVYSLRYVLRWPASPDVTDTSGVERQNNLQRHWRFTVRFWCGREAVAVDLLLLVQRVNTHPPREYAKGGHFDVAASLECANVATVNALAVS
jgi:hypothetical protein